MKRPLPPQGAEQLAEQLRTLCASRGRAVAAIDGRCASGKTTLAARLQEMLEDAGCPVSVVHMDDFFLPPELRTPERFAQPGGNVHYERFASEVLAGLAGDEPFEYGVFSCSQMAVTGAAAVDPRGICIVEGSYSTHPFFGAPYDLTVFLTVPPKEQERRIRARGGDGVWAAFRDRWIPLEEAYFAECTVRERADVVIENIGEETP